MWACYRSSGALAYKSSIIRLARSQQRPRTYVCPASRFPPRDQGKSIMWTAWDDVNGTKIITHHPAELRSRNELYFSSFFFFHVWLVGWTQSALMWNITVHYLKQTFHIGPRSFNSHSILWDRITRGVIQRVCVCYIRLYCYVSHECSRYFIGVGSAAFAISIDMQTQHPLEYSVEIERDILCLNVSSFNVHGGHTSHNCCCQKARQK